MLSSIFDTYGLTLPSVLTVLCLSALFGLISSLFYTKRNPAVSQSFALSLVILPVITSTVILVVNGNLGAGVAVAGSFSLIRFRSAQGGASEILAVFLSASLGLCLGAGYVIIACLLLIVVLGTLSILQQFHFAAAESQRELRISIPEALDYEGLFDDLLSQFSTCELVQVRTIEMGTAYQLIYHITPKGSSPGKDFLDSIRMRNGNLPVSLGRIPDTPALLM